MGVSQIWIKKAKNILQPMMRNLLRIKTTGSAPINMTQYKKLGLIETRHEYNKRGFLIKAKLILTPKAHRILSYVY